MAEIQLTRGLVAIVDDADFEWLSQWRWSAVGAPHTSYAARWNGATCRKERLHRVILDAPAGSIVDHANRNGLDNRRANLRFCSLSQNAANCGRHSAAGNPRGVFFDEDRGKWRARLVCGGHNYRSRRMDTAEAAARAYDELATRHFGPFAILNFPVAP